MISFYRHQSFLLFSLLVLLASFSLSAQTSPATLTITSNDSDNVITTGQVTLTATFSINMTASPTISITGVVTNVAMTQSTTAAVWTYYWQVPSNISSGTRRMRDINKIRDEEAIPLFGLLQNRKHFFNI